MKYYLLFFIIVLFSCNNNDKDTQNKNIIPDDPTLEQLNKLVNQNPDNDKILYERAKYFYSNENYDKTIKDLKQAIKIDSLNPVYYHLLADAYLDNAQPKYAINTLEEIINIYPERIPSLLKLSEFYFILKEYDKSISVLNGILYLSPNNPEAYYMLGQVFRETGQLIKAKNSFQTTVENNPEHIDAWLALGQISEQLHDTLAPVYYNNILKIDSANVPALHHLAYYYQNNNNIPKALETYKKIGIINPNYTAAFLNSGIIYLSLDSLKPAFDNFNIVCNIDKTDPRGYYYRALTRYYNEDYDEASKDIQIALKLNPDFEKAKSLQEKIK